MTCGLTWLAQPAVAQLQQAPVGGQPTAAGMGKSYPFPARADDLKPDEYWYRDKKIHRTGSAKLAYDLDAVRYDSKEKVWTRYNRGIDPTAKRQDTKNSDWITYGKKVYALADGEVSGCWRNFPENPTLGAANRTVILKLASAPESYFSESYLKTMTMGGGNHLYVEQSDGYRTLYAHFRPGTIPAALCPFSDTLTPPPPGGYHSTKLPEGSRPKVKRGQYLGRVGNSGNSGNPHLHIEIEKDGDMTLPFHGVSVKGINNNPDAPSDWTRLEGEVLPPGPIAILPD